MREVLAILGPSQVSFDEGAAPRVFAAVDALDAAVAVFCLVENALEALEATVRGHGHVHVHVHAGSMARDTRTVVIEVWDDGPGLTPATAESAFDRFFTTKSGHLGLGLNVVAGVASRWNGSVDLTNRVDGHAGAIARLVVPAVA